MNVGHAILLRSNAKRSRSFLGVERFIDSRPRPAPDLFDSPRASLIIAITGMGFDRAAPPSSGLSPNVPPAS